ncbi:Hypothetical predicted protein [Cloeon dipterum]|uniref:Bee-milk protein n=1 Tax=Cloeon dipterum TaxID=197152 RepID=A0A8S1C7L3_9INSE|nr:Hypothetical predicted protein [Cloeon dipterum]
MAPLYFLIVYLLCASATTLDFKSVFEWNSFEFNWTSEDSREKAVKDGRYKPEKIEPRFLALHEGKIFLSLSKQNGVPATLVWLSTDASSTSPTLNPYPSWPNQQEKTNCDKIVSARGIEVDTIGRLWALDDGSEEDCSPKLVIFNLTKNSVELSHLFPDSTVSLSFSCRYLVVFSLREKKSWRVEAQKIRSNAIALSPMNRRRHLYLSGSDRRDLSTVSIPEIRAGEKNLSLTSVGNTTGLTNRMIMDERGNLYFDLSLKSVVWWDTNRPFNKEQIYEEGRSNRPLLFAFDTNGNLWLMAQFTDQTPKSRLSRAAIGVKNYLYNASIDSSGTSKYVNGKKHQDLLVLNIILSIWNVFNLISTAFQIYWFHRMKKWQDSIAETETEGDQIFRPSAILPNKPPEPIYEEIDSAPYSSMQNTIVKSKM